ncbi:hypothetical protein LHO65_003567 [Vibrio cholerae]|nr:hypothetical protein [Vibrio cholerae]EII7298998.1 hypothetical protein [Vibrio cholerae]
MKFAAFVIFSLIANHVIADERRWICFVSLDERKPIYLAFSFDKNAGGGAILKYRTGSGVIFLRQNGIEWTEMAEGRPYEYTYDYTEVVDGADAGRYTVVVQGAIFYSFEYRSKNNGRVYRFKMDEESQNDNKCVWQ